jgi:beta-galactosidase
VSASSGETAKDSGLIYVSGIKPGVDSSIDVVSSDGKKLRVVVLTAQETEDAWKLRIGGADHLLITKQDFFADSEAQTERISLRSRNDPHFAFEITPPIAATLKASLLLTQTPGAASGFAAEAPAWNAALEWRQIQRAGIAPAVKIGPAPDGHVHGVAEAPGLGELPGAAKWAITVPAGAMNGLSELYMQVSYQGDVARLNAADRLLTDNFNNGQPWTIGLRRFLAPRGPSAFELSILPLRKDAPVYFEFASPVDFAPNGQADKLEGLRLVPEYQLRIDAACN